MNDSRPDELGVDELVRPRGPDALVLAAAWRRIVNGEPARRGEIAAETGLDGPDLEAVLTRLEAEGRLTVNDAGEVVGARGLSLVPTPHRLELNGRPLYVWCAIDAVGIPAAVGADARARSRCVHCGAPVEVRFVRGHLAGDRRGRALAVEEAVTFAAPRWADLV